MANVIRYNNNMNSVAFGKFKEKELDLFFSICFKLKEQETKEITLSFSELRELSHYENRNLSRFVKALDETYNKMLGLNIKIYENEFRWTRFNLFSKYTVDAAQKTVTIATNQEFRHILNELTGNYTKFELMEFVNLKSIYSKNVFKLLKQWHSIGLFEVDIEEFRRILDIPPKYRMSEIDKYVLSPVMVELPLHFLNLKLEKIKSGKNVSKLKFTWAKGIEIIQDEKDRSKEKRKTEVHHGEQLNIFQDKTIKKAERELTVEEITKKKEEMKRLLKKEEEICEQKINIKRDETSIFIEEKENYMEQNNFDILPDNNALISEKNILSDYEEFIEWKKMKKKDFKEKQEVYRDEKEKSDLEFNITKEAIRGGRFFTEKDIEENLLLDKNGNKLNGIALKMRVRKILKDMN